MRFALLLAVLIFGCDVVASADKPATRPAEIVAKLVPDKNNKVHLTDAEWKQILTAEQYRVLRQKGTERPFGNEFDHHFGSGVYSCAGCGQELFRSNEKYDSGCGWPAFWAAGANGTVVEQLDTDGERVEVLCSRCKGHLGHVFTDGPPPTGRRFCINSVSMTFTPTPTTKPAE